MTERRSKVLIFPSNVKRLVSRIRTEKHNINPPTFRDSMNPTFFSLNIYVFLDKKIVTRESATAAVSTITCRPYFPTLIIFTITGVRLFSIISNIMKVTTILIKKVIILFLSLSILSPYLKYITNF